MGTTATGSSEGGTVIRPSVFEAEHPDLDALPEALQAVVRDALPSAPAPGQFWRITWADLPPRLGIVLDVGDAWTVIAPVTLDMDHRVDAAFVLDRTPLDVPTVAWPQLRTGMGDFALAECYGSVDTDTLQTVRDRAGVRPTPEVLDAWNDDLDPTTVQSRRTYRDRLAGEFAALCDSDWNEADLRDEFEVYVDSDAARRAGLTMKTLAEITGLPDDAAYPVWRGEHPVPAQAQTLLVAALGDAMRDGFRTSPTDPGARAALNSPEVREQIAAAAESENVTETIVRRDLYRDLVAAPGRETGPRDQRDYRQRLQMLLAARHA